MRVLATVRYSGCQFNHVQQPVMAYGIVPNAAIFYSSTPSYEKSV
jgi:hypothetical protein